MINSYRIRNISLKGCSQSEQPPVKCLGMFSLVQTIDACSVMIRASGTHLASPACDHEHVQREAVRGVEGMRLCNVQVEIALRYPTLRGSNAITHSKAETLACLLPRFTPLKRLLCLQGHHAMNRTTYMQF